MTRFEISGVATDEESAAVAAVVAQVLSAEAEVLAAPPPRPRHSDWVRAWQPRVPRLRSRPEAPAAPQATDTEDE